MTNPLRPISRFLRMLLSPARPLPRDFQAERRHREQEQDLSLLRAEANAKRRALRDWPRRGDFRG